MTTARDLLALVEPDHQFHSEKIHRMNGEEHRLICSCGWKASYMVNLRVMEDLNNLPERIYSWIALERQGHLMDQELPL